MSEFKFQAWSNKYKHMFRVNKIWHRAEVIGNIYQNANLLEEPK